MIVKRFEELVMAITEKKRWMNRVDEKRQTQLEVFHPQCRNHSIKFNSILKGNQL